MRYLLAYRNHPLSTLLGFDSERKVILIEIVSYLLDLLLNLNMIQINSTHRLSLGHHFEGFNLLEILLNSHEFQTLQQLNP